MTTSINESERFMELATLEELRKLIRYRQITTQLVEQLASSLQWLLHYSEKYKIPLPEQDKIISLIDGAIEIEQKLPQIANFGINRNFTERRSTDDYTEPPRIIFLSNFPSFVPKQ